MDLATLALAAVAGVLSTLSPCVLPLLPAILVGARSEHRLGPLALAGGLALSFAGLGLFVATIGFALGLDPNLFRFAGGGVMMAIGVILLVPAAQYQVAALAGPIQTWTEARFGGGPKRGVAGQFGLGLLLGAVWAPCVGPTLGAASLLAAQGENLPVVALTMVLFGLGAALPVLLLGLVTRQATKQVTGFGRRLAGYGKPILGVVLLVVGLLVVTGFDKQIEAALVAISPEWLTSLTTAI